MANSGKHRNVEQEKSCFWLVISMLFVTIVGADFIRWELITRPVMLGINVSMMCTITVDSEPAHMAWRKIPNGQAIAYNKAAINSSKYEVQLIYKDQMIYYLTIKDFSLDDVNHIYRCESEFLKDSGNVSIEYFIAMPSMDEVTCKFSVGDGLLNGSVIIPHVYPTPVCDVKFQEQNITGFAAIKSYRPIAESVFYTFKVDLLFKTNDCSGIVNISCSVGIRSLIITQQLNCTVEKFGSSQFDKIYVGLGIVAAIVTAIVIAYIIAYNRHSKGKLCSENPCVKHLNKESETAVNTPMLENTQIA